MIGTRNALGADPRNQLLHTDDLTAIRMNLATFLGITLGVTLFISNILAAKIWCLGPLTFDGGLILFPITYVLGDLLAELFGKKAANRIAIQSALINLIGFAAIKIVDLLPAAPDMDNVTSFSNSLNLSGRIIIASIIGFLLSSFVNNFIVSNLRKCTVDNEVGLRAWTSSFCARIVDTVLFNVLAFAGNMDFLSLLKHMGYAMLAGTIVETILIHLLTIRCCKFLRAVIKQ